MSLDLSLVRTVAQQSADTANVLAAVSKCRPRLNMMSVPAIRAQMRNRSGNSSKHEDIVSVLRLCEQAGAGHLVDGGLQTRARFIWKVRPQSFVASVQNVAIDLVASDFFDRDAMPAPSSAAGAVRPGWVRYSFPLREGEEVTLDLPADLTERESQRLGHLIQAAARQP